ncbi:hypothetical protein VNO77_44156 [Canavalia gladiata]|uniref:Uncharacterized protein n=1 Tax=Canavalia gladiata TaxID=3824 RepID=A0AAN9PNJ5_CANGL
MKGKKVKRRKGKLLGNLLSACFSFRITSGFSATKKKSGYTLLWHLSDIPCVPWLLALAAINFTLTQKKGKSIDSSTAFKLSYSTLALVSYRNWLNSE